MATITEHEKALVSDLKSLDRPSRRDLRETLENHASWLDTAGEVGTRADLSTKNLESADLADSRLAAAVPQNTIWTSHCLTLAPLRRAARACPNPPELTV